MNDFLDQPFDAEEIKIEIKQMHPSKALGSDGFPALFYKNF